MFYLNISSLCYQFSVLSCIGISTPNSGGRNYPRAKQEKIFPVKKFGAGNGNHAVTINFYLVIEVCFYETEVPE